MMKHTQQFQTQLLQWYDKHGRKDLPWQVDNSYFVWISEIMLQQTQVLKVVDYFNVFICKFPTMQNLARYKVSDVLQLWSGLGYYNRARNIHKTAVICNQNYNNNLPKDLNKLMELPGIGRTTAAAILSLAHDLPESILDGNVKRVISRVYKVKAKKLPQLNKKLWQIVENLMPQQRAKNYNQALMDLGSLVCKRTNPNCDDCPLNKLCRATIDHQVAMYPQKKVKTKQLPVTLHALLWRKGTKILLQQRQENGIWVELWFLPLFETSSNLYQLCGTECQFEIKHQLSHRILTIKVTVITQKLKRKLQGQWVNTNKLNEIPHPSALVKILKNNLAV